MEYLILLQILITEIHPTPAAGEPEWVECAIQTAGPVRLDTLLVCDNRSCARLPRVEVEKGACLILTRDEQALRETRTLPTGVVTVECALPSLNNSTDRVEVRCLDSSLIDVVAYSVLPAERGRSIERCGSVLDGLVVYNDTWLASQAFDSATCGRVNSHIVYERDVGITGMFVQDSILNIGVLNQGRVRAQSQSITITIGDFTVTRTCPPLDPKTWWSTRVHLAEILPASSVRLEKAVALVHDADMRAENNRYEQVLTIPPVSGSITISEILADPHEGDCDFVEIWNGTADTVNLSDWTIQEVGGQSCRIVGLVRLAPNSFIACASDTAIVRMSAGNPWALVKPGINVHSLSDSITLRTSSGFIVDKAVYDKDNHTTRLVDTEGRSLEKRSMRAFANNLGVWGSSTATSGCTPGSVNSIAVEPSTTDALLTAMPSPFSTNEGAERFPCVISWNQPFEQAFARMTVVSIDGVPVAELLNGEFIGTKGSVVWNGNNTATHAPASVGIYVAAFECIDAASNAVVRGTCPVVIGESR